MECRAINAEEESGLLKEQLEDLKKQLTEVLGSCSFVDSWSLRTISLSNHISYIHYFISPYDANTLYVVVILYLYFLDLAFDALSLIVFSKRRKRELFCLVLVLNFCLYQLALITSDFSNNRLRLID